MKKVGLFLAFCLLLLGIAAWYGWVQYKSFLATPLDIPDGGTLFVLDSGATGAGIVRQLAGMGLTTSGWKWRLLMRLEPHVYQAGEYLIEPGLAPRGVLDKLSSGAVVQYRFTLVEGWTYRQLLAALAEEDKLEFLARNIPRAGFCRKPTNSPGEIQIGTFWSGHTRPCSRRWPMRGRAGTSDCRSKRPMNC